MCQNVCFRSAALQFLLSAPGFLQGLSRNINDIESKYEELGLEDIEAELTITRALVDFGTSQLGMPLEDFDVPNGDRKVGKMDDLMNSFQAKTLLPSTDNITTGVLNNYLKNEQGKYSQKDSHEFLTKLIEWINGEIEECIRRLSIATTNGGETIENVVSQYFFF